jgi:hypothetical protein
MAGQAWQADMAARQRELSLVVIESRRLPGSRAVTLGAVMIEIVGHMVRIGYCGEIAAVTGIAVCWCQCVPGSVTVYAGGSGVRTGQRELGRRMIESGRLPCGSVVAGRAIVVKGVGLVIRVGRCRKITAMAGVTRRIGARITTGVTVETLQRYVCSSQGE